MTIIHLHDRSIERIAEQYAASLRPRAHPISISAAIRAVRMVAPNVPHNDNELASIIASYAVRHGHAIDFDTQ